MHFADSSIPSVILRASDQTLSSKETLIIVCSRRRLMLIIARRFIRHGSISWKIYRWYSIMPRDPVMPQAFPYTNTHIHIYRFASEYGGPSARPSRRSLFSTWLTYGYILTRVSGFPRRRLEIRVRRLLASRGTGKCLSRRRSRRREDGKLRECTTIWSSGGIARMNSSAILRNECCKHALIPTRALKELI